jgi:ADP-ribosyl-[dinitrogen reductase] hydrolase
MTRTEIARSLGRHTEIVGGGPFGWAPGEGTDDSDLAVALARAYQRGYSLEEVAARFVAWYRSGPRDIGGTTARALRLVAGGADPRVSGQRHERSAANGGLMRAVATGLVRRRTATRRLEAAEVSSITHAERRCVQAAVAYCDLVSHLVEVVNLGGDADTTGAVAGGLLGAYHGASSIPLRWKSALHYGPELTDSLVPAMVTMGVRRL